MEIHAIISRVNFYNKDNGYSVLLVSLEKNQYQILKKKSHLIGNKLVVVGNLDRVPLIDEEYTFIGDFTKDANYGLQFKFTEFKRSSLENSEGLISYLSSELFVGIGIVTAKNIVKELGTDCINKIINDKNCLLSIGIKKSQADTIYNTLVDNKNSQEAMLFFINNGISMEMCHRILNTFGSDAVSIVKESPYILMEKIERFGFVKNDAFALRMGIKKDSKIRLLAVMSYVLKNAIYSTGNSYLQRSDLLMYVNKFLEGITIDEVLYNEVLEELKIKKVIFESTDNLIFDYSLYEKERKLALLITNKLLKQKLDYKQKNIDSAFSLTERAINIELSELQKTAVKAAFTEPLVIITGGPGTGKTTIVKAILNMYVALHKNNDSVLEGVALLAPTGKASKRLKELTNFNAQTIHKYLGYQGEDYFEYSEENPTDSKLIIIDEASMMDLPLAYQLFSSIRKDAQVIIVGDVDQLPSVGPGQILKDLIDTKEIRTIRLNKIHRQAQDSKIIQLAHSVNEGLIPENFTGKFYDRIFIPSDSDNIIPLINEWVKLAISKGKSLTTDIQVLAPMYRCKNGINELNIELQNIANPKTNDEELKHLGQTFRINDKVIQLVNRSEKKVMNGDIGIIASYLYKNGEINGVQVQYDFGLVDYTLEELEDLKLAYSISIHKSQGSEFDIVIMPLSPSFYYMFKRKLIYTAITRAKKMLVLIGDPKTFQKGIGLIEAKRLTILKDLIISNISGKNVIDDTTSAFKSLGEVETTLDNLSPYDFLDTPKSKVKKEVNESELKDNDFLGETEFDLNDF